MFNVFTSVCAYFTLLLLWFLSGFLKHPDIFNFFPVKELLVCKKRKIIKEKKRKIMTIKNVC